MFKLVIQDDEGKTTVVPLIRDEITIGRKEGNTIRLTERNVSRRHARILRNNGEVQIEDLGSYNGIRVNNARIAERVSLRVSDQVQIGDYKLYLKAEGVEQVDDARTMPIERVDTANTATDVIPAIVPPAPTAPMSVATPAPGTLPPAAQLIGNPNRTLVAVADTDPQNRPVASQAQIAAVLSSPMGYGKLVVLSSNFAGKEFELSRPQMIIGRTDENDIVINHRSISRNHAKLVRETDNGRYTISDLQSSNGVRVNGQDYGKVELRRGDVVDLGHVRLRFVEAGEDFVFARDAVITDVPDTQSKKGLLYASIVALVLLAAVIIYFVVKKDDTNNTDTKNGSNVALADAGSEIAVATVDAIEVAPPLDTAPPVGDSKDTLKLQCSTAADGQRWTDLIKCGEQLRTLDKAEGDRFYKTGRSELDAEVAARNFNTAMDEGALKKAKLEYDKIGPDSVYRKDVEARYKPEAVKRKAELEAKLKSYAKRNDACASWKTLLNQSKADLPSDIIDEARKAESCQAVAIKDPIKEPVERCNAEELADKGQEHFTSNNWTQALVFYEKAYNCRNNPVDLLKVFASACKAKNVAKARTYWKKMGQQGKDQGLTFCVSNNITFEMLNQ